MTITPQDVARLAELLSRATPGEWASGYCEEDGHHVFSTGHCVVACCLSEDQGHFHGDAVFIAAARNLLPGLLAERERLRAACKLAYGIVQRDHRQPCQCMLCDALSFAGIATGGADDNAG